MKKSWTMGLAAVIMLFAACAKPQPPEVALEAREQRPVTKFVLPAATPAPEQTAEPTPRPTATPSPGPTPSPSPEAASTRVALPDAGEGLYTEERIGDITYAVPVAWLRTDTEEGYAYGEDGEENGSIFYVSCRVVPGLEYLDVSDLEVARLVLDEAAAYVDSMAAEPELLDEQYAEVNGNHVKKLHLAYKEDGEDKVSFVGAFAKGNGVYVFIDTMPAGDAQDDAQTVLESILETVQS